MLGIEREFVEAPFRAHPAFEQHTVVVHFAQLAFGRGEFRIAGQRACCGNYNAPGNIGVFLNDLPANNHLHVTDDIGRPRRGANVRIYRAVSGPGWYGKTIDNTPDLEFTTDSAGYAG